MNLLYLIYLAFIVEDNKKKINQFLAVWGLFNFDSWMFDVSIVCLSTTWPKSPTTSYSPGPGMVDFLSKIVVLLPLKIVLLPELFILERM